VSVSTEPERPPARRTLGAAGLIAIMALGSIMMWLGAPIGLLFLASRLSDSANPTMGPVLIVVLGLPACMVAIGKVLAVLDRYYGRYTGLAAGGPHRAPWLKSMRGERGPTRRRTVLDTVMVASVSAALVLMAIWFFFLASYEF